MSENWSTQPAFGNWLKETHATLIARQSAQVPCGSCTACCRSGQFIHIAEQEPAFAVVPKEILVPAPGMHGVWLMGHEAGVCPMLKNEACSIYHERPQTCRSYDCRIFHAAGQYPADSQPEVASRASRECFQYPAQSDRERLSTVRQAADFIQANQTELFGNTVNEIQISLTAIKVHEAFLVEADDGERLLRIKAVLQP